MELQPFEDLDLDKLGDLMNNEEPEVTEPQVEAIPEATPEVVEEVVPAPEAPVEEEVAEVVVPETKPEAAEGTEEVNDEEFVQNLLNELEEGSKQLNEAVDDAGGESTPEEEKQNYEAIKKQADKFQTQVEMLQSRMRDLNNENFTLQNDNSELSSFNDFVQTDTSAGKLVSGLYKLSKNDDSGKDGIVQAAKDLLKKHADIDVDLLAQSQIQKEKQGMAGGTPSGVQPTPQGMTGNGDLDNMFEMV